MARVDTMVQARSECRDVRGFAPLASMEWPGRGHKPGRMRLTSFYNLSGYTDWEFGETPAYLRALGALEEVESGVQRVITTNFIQSMPNCIDSSSCFNVCCRNECEDMMAHLAKDVSAPLADSERRLQLVAALPSDTVTASP